MSSGDISLAKCILVIGKDQYFTVTIRCSISQWLLETNLDYVAVNEEEVEHIDDDLLKNSLCCVKK